MSELVAELVKVCITFVFLGSLLTIVLQNMNEGVFGKLENATTGEYVEIGLWFYCIHSRRKLNLVNKNPEISRELNKDLCVSFDRQLFNTSEVAPDVDARVVPEVDLLIAGQILSILSLCILFASALLYNLAEMSKCLLGVVAMGAVLTVMSQVSISTLTVFYWSLHRDHMSMGYAWICGYVALGLVMLLLILILVSCCCTLIPEEEHRIPIEHDVEKAEKFARWVLILLFLPALAFQMVIHSDDGGVLKDKAFRDRTVAKHGMWRYCLENRSEIVYFLGIEQKIMTSSHLCIEINDYLPVEMIKSDWLLTAIAFTFVAHVTTCSCFLLSIYPFHVKSYRSRKCLFAIRFVISLVMASCLTIASALCTSSIPDKWSIDFGFICPWVAVGVMWVIFILCTIQLFWVKNIFGEMPEVLRHVEEINGEKRPMKSFDYYDPSTSSLSSPPMNMNHHGVPRKN